MVPLYDHDVESLCVRHSYWDPRGEGQAIVTRESSETVAVITVSYDDRVSTAWVIDAEYRAASVWDLSCDCEEAGNDILQSRRNSSELFTE